MSKAGWDAVKAAEEAAGTRGVLVAGGRVLGSIPLPPGTRIEPPIKRELPPDNVPFHRQERADGLAIDVSIAGYQRKRWSPRRNRWADVGAFDESVRQLEAKQTAVNSELAAAQEQLLQAHEDDRAQLATWVAEPHGDRPSPLAPGIEPRIADLAAERDALTTAVERVLDEKERYVTKHRGRLTREAEKACARAVERLAQAISAVEEARAEAVDCVAAQRWATEFPGERADAGSLRLEHMRGGRLTSALPDFKGLAVSVQVIEWLRDDSRWLATVLGDEQRQRDELDPHHEAIWESSPEGRKAINLANQRIAEQTAPRNVGKAGWGD